MNNEYDGVLELWQLAIIKRQVQRHGIQRNDMDDAVQYVAIGVADFRFDENKSNGGSPEAVFCIFVNHTLSKFVRAQSRARRRDKIIKEIGVNQACEKDFGLTQDLATIRNRLLTKDRNVMDLLKSMKPSDIARELGVTRRKIEVRILRIRKAFKDAGY